MNLHRETVTIHSNGAALAGMLFLPASDRLSPALVLCHGALEFKENYFELGEFLAARGVAALAIDMHGHGQSEGERFHVDMCEWVEDVRATVDFLVNHPQVDGDRIGAFGLSSGGTAILEAALVEPRLKALVSLDGTVRNTFGFAETLVFQLLILAGTVKKLLTRQDLRFSLMRMAGGIRVASDPEVNQKLVTDPCIVEAYSSFPLPGAAQCFFVDTLKRVGGITAPTLVLHGADDQLDPPKSAQLLYDALTCEKQLCIIPGNGHVGHMDRHKDRVMELIADWALKHLT
jgi:alpha-beta hydrolase superfamily lysophospholipase